ncbi:MAG: hypothetical protein HXY39_00680 [Chloroflexi bacterium]|nr:hypothetical protein [Chloroflexota bacterium]
MGMDISGAGGYFRWTNLGWSEVLSLARSAGWEPVGTGPPRGVLKADWSGTYFSNDGQLVYARDAKRLADALERAIAECPAEDNETLREFIAFCRAGSFRLH